MTRDLSRLFRPRSIAVIGGGAWGPAVVEQCLKMGFAGEIWPVHPTRDQMHGVPCHREHRGAAGRAGRDLHRRQPPPDHRDRGIPGGARRRWRGLLCLGLCRGRGRPGGRRLAAGPAGAGGGRDAGAGAELLWPHQLPRRRAALARPARRRAGRQRRRDPDPVIERAAQPDHAETRSATGLCRRRREPGADGAGRDVDRRAGGSARHRRRPAHRGRWRRPRLRGDGGAGARAEQARGGAEDRPLRAGARRDRQPHGLAGRRRRGRPGVPGAAGHSDARHPSRAAGDAEALPCPRRAAGARTLLAVLLGRRGGAGGGRRHRSEGALPATGAGGAGAREGDAGAAGDGGKPA